MARILVSIDKPARQAPAVGGRAQPSRATGRIPPPGLAATDPPLQQAFTEHPDLAKEWSRIGPLLAANRLPEAQACCRHVVAAAENSAQAWYVLGVVLAEAGAREEAVRCLQVAVRLQPGLALAWRRLGMLFGDLQQLDLACQAWEQAAALRPGSGSAHLELARLHHRAGRGELAQAQCDRALEASLTPFERRRLGFLLLTYGRYPEGFRQYEGRLELALPDARGQPPRLDAPLWQGESLQGRSILVWPEQGAGDEIQFVRFARELKARGAARVTWATSRWALLDLLKTAEGVDRVVLTSALPERHDCWCWLMSLPTHLGTTLPALPAALPYLRTPARRAQHWASRLPAGPKVGVVWRGEPKHFNDANRSLPGLQTLAALWGVANLTFISLQKGAGEDEARQPPPDQPLLAVGPLLRDFSDTAAVIEQLDLVICVDTSVAHLAGALGKPVWVLLPARGTDWRWLTERADSPWYPGVMRLFRQTEAGHWTDVVEQLVQALHGWVSSRAREQFRGAAQLQDQRRFAEAAALYRSALDLQPDLAAARYRLGIVLLAMGRPGDAEAVFREALQRHPADAEAWSHLGIFLGSTGRAAEALEVLRRSVELDPAQANTWSNLGNAWEAQGAPAEAESAFRRAVALSPGHVPAQNRLFRLLVNQGRLAEAEATSRQALLAAPSAAALHANLGDILSLTAGAADAEAAYRAALDLDGTFAPAWGGLGQALRRQGRVAESEAAFRQALAGLPSAIDTHGYSTAFLLCTGRLQEAEVLFGRAAARKRDHPAFQVSLAHFLLSKGRFTEGWSHYEARYDPRHKVRHAVAPKLRFPAWQGESLEGRSLLLWPEQGLGDAVQMIRYASVLKARGLRQLTVHCFPALQALLETAPGVDRVVTQRQEVQPHDFWCLQMSLPLRLGTTLETIPADLPYLKAPAERIARWKPRLPAGRKVGLAWKGSTLHSNDAWRSLPGLATLAPLWQVPRLRFVSLQKGEGETEAAAPPAGLDLVPLGHDFTDLADAAAVIEQLDLVICIDTVTAHVAGALGKPVWVLLPAWETDWRWLRDRTDSPWYPGVMRLFRQQQPRNWEPVVKEVVQALRAWADQPAGTS